MKITPAGVATVFIGGLNEPTGLAFGSAGNLYAANGRGSSISKITPDGVAMFFAGGLSGPQGLAFTSDAGQPLSLPVPEPSSFALLGAGVLLLFAWCRRTMRLKGMQNSFRAWLFCATR